MDLAPRALSRWLPWLGIALAVQGLLGFALLTTARHPDALMFFDIPYYTLMLFWGIVLHHRSKDNPERDTHRGLFYGGLAALSGAALDGRTWVAAYLSDGQGSAFPQALGSLCLTLAAPCLLGVALASRVDPDPSRLRLAARISAVVAIAGFMLTAYVTFRDLIGSDGKAFARLRIPPLQMALEVLYVVIRVFLFGAAVISLRPPTDGDVSRRLSLLLRATLGVLAASAASWILTAAFNFDDFSPWRNYHWRSLIGLTLFPTVALLLALTLEKPGLGYKSWRNRNSQGGAEA